MIILRVSLFFKFSRCRCTIQKCRCTIFQNFLVFNSLSLNLPILASFGLTPFSHSLLMLSEPFFWVLLLQHNFFFRIYFLSERCRNALISNVCVIFLFLNSFINFEFFCWIFSSTATDLRLGSSRHYSAYLGRALHHTCHFGDF